MIEILMFSIISLIIYSVFLIVFSIGIILPIFILYLICANVGSITAGAIIFGIGWIIMTYVLRNCHKW